VRSGRPRHAKFLASVHLTATPYALSAGVIACMLALVQSPSAGDKSVAADLYVSAAGQDANSGSQGSPFRTITAASRHAQAGTVIHVAPGRYAGGFTTAASGAAGAPVHYLSDVRSGARIVPSTEAIADMAWNNKGEYVIIDGFEVEGSDGGGGSPWRFGLYTSGAHSAIINCLVHHLGFPCTALGGAGISGDSYYRGFDIDLVSNIVHDIGPDRCAFVHGIYQTATGVVANNLVYRTSGWGIHLWHDAHDVLIANNTIFNSSYGGIVVGAGNQVHGQPRADQITVANNIAFDNAGIGIAEVGLTGFDNLFTNNLSYGNGRNWRLRTSQADKAAVRADPAFIRYDRDGGGDYRLAAGSPAIDAGIAAYAPRTDLNGIPRPRDGRCDIGAFQAPR
jgi:Right handed beta helix region/Protein of unknown function (DUF1565)